MHAHVSGNDGLLNLAAASPPVRDLANDTMNFSPAANASKMEPKLVRASFSPVSSMALGLTRADQVLAATEAEARAAVDNYVKLGYVQIKIYSSVKPELVPVIIDEAHKNGLRVSGHIPPT